MLGGTQIIITENAVEPIAVVEELEFLARLLVAIDRGHIDIDHGARIEVDRRVAGVLAPCADALERQCEIGRASCRDRVCQYGYVPVVCGSVKKNTMKKHIFS